jgi:hypothetical protein
MIFNTESFKNVSDRIKDSAYTLHLLENALSNIFAVFFILVLDGIVYSVIVLITIFLIRTYAFITIFLSILFFFISCFFLWKYQEFFVKVFEDFSDNLKKLPFGEIWKIWKIWKKSIKDAKKEKAKEKRKELLYFATMFISSAVILIVYLIIEIYLVWPIQIATTFTQVTLIEATQTAQVVTATWQAEATQTVTTSQTAEAITVQQTVTASQTAETITIQQTITTSQTAETITIEQTITTSQTAEATTATDLFVPSTSTPSATTVAPPPPSDTSTSIPEPSPDTPTNTPPPTATNTSAPTEIPTITPLPTDTLTPLPTNTPTATNTPPPTATPIPTATPTPFSLLAAVHIEDCGRNGNEPIENCSPERDPNSSNENAWLIRWREYPSTNISTKDWFYVVSIYGSTSQPVFTKFVYTPTSTSDPKAELRDGWLTTIIDKEVDLPNQEDGGCSPYWDVIIATKNESCPKEYISNGICQLTEFPKYQRPLGTSRQGTCPTGGGGGGGPSRVRP